MTRIRQFQGTFALLAVFSCSAIPAFAQLPPGQVFADVPQTDPEYAATTTLYQLGISVGCDATPDFCPSQTLLRSDMAAFIVRAWSARVYNDPEGFPIDPNQPQYFSDVAPDAPGAPDPQYKYIEKLYELGITSGTAGPTIDPNTGALLAMGQFSPGSPLAIYQIATFIARAGWLASQGCTAAYFGGALKPFTTSTNATCSPNAFPSNQNEEPYFGDDCSPSATPSFPGCPQNPADTFYTYIQRLGDLGVFQSPSNIVGSPGCYSCFIQQNNTVVRSQMAIWTVTGMGLLPESVLNINSPTGPNVWSTLPTITVPFTFTIYNQPAASIVFSQFLLSNTSGDTIQNPLYCYGAWAAADLKLDMTNPTPLEAFGYGSPLADSFCTVSLVSVTSVTNGTQATVNFTFAPTAQGATYNVFHEVYYNVGQDPWENVGTLTVQTPPSLSVQPAVTLTDTSQSNGYFLVNDYFSLTLTGPIMSPAPYISVSVNGVISGVQSLPSNGTYTAAGQWVSSGTYTEVWYVNGVPANPTLQFSVLSQPPSATLVNVWYSGLYIFNAGDPYLFNITGVPNQPVVLQYSQSGTTGQVTVGQTDANGNFQYPGQTPGTWGASDFGDWVDTWSVGGLPAGLPISFSVGAVGCPVQ